MKEIFRRKSIVMGIAIGFCICLAGCGNPLKKLPEVTEENMYNEETGSTGDEVADMIIDYLEENNAIQGNVVSFMVYERNDPPKAKDETNIGVQVIYETAYAQYDYHFKLHCVYDETWKATNYQVDDVWSIKCNPIHSVDEETLKEDISYYVGACTLDSGSYILYSDNLISATVVNENIDGDHESVTVAVESQDEYRTMTGTLVMEYDFNQEENCWEYANNYVANDDFVSVYNEDITSQISDERVIQDLTAIDMKIVDTDDWPICHLSMDMFSDYEISDYKFNQDICSRIVTLHLKNTSIFNGTYILRLRYVKDGDTWEFDSYEKQEYVFELVNLAGEYAGDIIDDETGAVVGSMTLSITEQDLTAQTFSGVLTQNYEGTKTSEISGYVNDTTRDSMAAPYAIPFTFSDSFSNHISSNRGALFFDYYTGNLVYFGEYGICELSIVR